MSQPILPLGSPQNDTALGCLTLIVIIIVLFMLLTGCSSPEPTYYYLVNRQFLEYKRPINKYCRGSEEYEKKMEEFGELYDKYR